jgi:hypothetical protein
MMEIEQLVRGGSLLHKLKGLCGSTAQGQAGNTLTHVGSPHGPRHGTRNQGDEERLGTFRSQ